MKSHRDILALWGTYAELRRQLLAQGHELSEMLVARWAQRNSIPAEWWAPVIAAAKEAGHSEVTLELLVATAPRSLPAGAA